MSLHVLLAGPIAGEELRPWLQLPRGAALSAGYMGAPLMAILVGELLRLGHRVTALTHDHLLPWSEGPRRFSGPGLQFIVCPVRRRVWRPNGWLPGRIVDLFAHERRLLAAEMRAAAPDVVHAHWTYEFALAGLDQPAPLLVTCHDAPGVVLRYTRSPYRALRWLMARQVFRRAQHFTTVSDYMARELAPAIGQLPPVVPNPVAPYVFELGRARQCPASRRVAMVCNGWDRRKNPQPALRAFAQYRRGEPTAELHAFGAAFGPGEEAERWATAKGLTEGVHFHGRLPHRQVVERLASMDVLLHPSLEESFGVVIAEAMALGLPVVAGRRSGAVPWVMGADQADAAPGGVLVDPTEPTAIVQGLERAFGKHYAAYSKRAAQRATAFSAHNVAIRYTERYGQLLISPLRSPDATGALALTHE
jgi:glycosyltransferase involved in cell wall biosynthesis